MEMFAIAARKKLRFDTVKGQITAEDLWDLPLTSDTGRPNLDDIAKKLHKALKDDKDMSFVTSTVANTAAFNTLKTKFDIVKFVIDVKLEEAEKAKKVRANKEKNQRIMELIAQRADAELAAKPTEELMAMLAGEDAESESESESEA